MAGAGCVPPGRADRDPGRGCGSLFDADPGAELLRAAQRQDDEGAVAALFAGLAGADSGVN